MACSKYEYVKQFEQHQTLMPQTYMVLRIDGKGFTKFTSHCNFEKPNDRSGLLLMNKSAEEVMKQFPEIWLAYGQSDEFSFVFQLNSNLFSRRIDKIVSCGTSVFTAAYIYNFHIFFPQIGGVLPSLPSFDGRVVCYPSQKILRDYLSWRQVDCHINNLYNTLFWRMVGSGKYKTNSEVQEILKKTDSEKKHQILHDDFNINYNDIDPMFRKGSTLIRNYQIIEKQNSQIKLQQPPYQEQQIENETENIQKQVKQKSSKLNKNKSKYQQKMEKKYDKLENGCKVRKKQVIEQFNDDIIGEEFWNKHKIQLFAGETEIISQNLNQ